MFIFPYADSRHAHLVFSMTTFFHFCLFIACKFRIYKKRIKGFYCYTVCCQNTILCVCARALVRAYIAQLLKRVLPHFASFFPLFHSVLSFQFLFLSLVCLIGSFVSEPCACFIFAAIFARQRSNRYIRQVWLASWHECVVVRSFVRSRTHNVSDDFFVSTHVIICISN